MVKDKVDFYSVRKDLIGLPKETLKRLSRWRFSVEMIGLKEVRKIPGYHDEPLQGKWFGFRSARLGKKWRLIYKHHKGEPVSVVMVKRISAHEY